MSGSVLELCKQAHQLSRDKTPGVMVVSVPNDLYIEQPCVARRSLKTDHSPTCPHGSVSARVVVGKHPRNASAVTVCAVRSKTAFSGNIDRKITGFSFVAEFVCLACIASIIEFASCRLSSTVAQSIAVTARADGPLLLQEIFWRKGQPLQSSGSVSSKPRRSSSGRRSSRSRPWRHPLATGRRSPCRHRRP